MLEVMAAKGVVSDNAEPMSSVQVLITQAGLV